MIISLKTVLKSRLSFIKFLIILKPYKLFIKLKTPVTSKTKTYGLSLKVFVELGNQSFQAKFQVTLPDPQANVHLRNPWQVALKQWKIVMMRLKRPVASRFTEATCCLQIYRSYLLSLAVIKTQLGDVRRPGKRFNPGTVCRHPWHSASAHTVWFWPWGSSECPSQQYSLQTSHTMYVCSTYCTPWSLSVTPTTGLTHRQALPTCSLPSG